MTKTFLNQINKSKSAVVLLQTNIQWVHKKNEELRAGSPFSEELIYVSVWYSESRYRSIIQDAKVLQTLKWHFPIIGTRDGARFFFHVKVDFRFYTCLKFAHCFFNFVFPLNFWRNNKMLFRTNLVVLVQLVIVMFGYFLVSGKLLSHCFARDCNYM